MILRVFLPAISALALLFGAQNTTCPDDYSPSTFEEAPDELIDWIDEHFTQAKIPFPPKRSDLTRLGLSLQDNGSYIRADSILHSKFGQYPLKSGLWRVEFPGSGIVIFHLLIIEPEPLGEIRAFNTINDALGGIFNDYDDEAYKMRMLPEDRRFRIGERFFTINVHIYGVNNDASALKRTVEDFIFTSYDSLIQKMRRCMERR